MKRKPKNLTIKTLTIKEANLRFFGTPFHLFYSFAKLRGICNLLRIHFCDKDFFDWSRHSKSRATRRAFRCMYRTKGDMSCWPCVLDSFEWARRLAKVFAHQWIDKRHRLPESCELKPRQTKHTDLPPIAVENGLLDKWNGEKHCINLSLPIHWH